MSAPRDFDPRHIGVIVVDHGSRVAESNEMLLRIADSFRDHTDFTIVEPAHMDLAKPTIADAFMRCVQQGARLVIVHPFFLLPGRHWREDIPRLTREAAEQHSGIRYLVTAPLAASPLLTDVMASQITHCVGHALESGDACELCAYSDLCQVRS